MRSAEAHDKADISLLSVIGWETRKRRALGPKAFSRDVLPISLEGRNKQHRPPSTNKQRTSEESNTNDRPFQSPKGQTLIPASVAQLERAAIFYIDC